MSTVNSFDKNQHLAELNQPLFGVNPAPMSPSARKAAARANLGVTAAGDGVTGQRFGNEPLVQSTVTAINTTGTAAAAALLGGIITSTTAAAVAITLPTGTLFEAAIVAAYPNVQNGDTYEFVVANLGGTNAITFVAGTNFTLAGGTPTIPANGSRVMLARRTSQNNWVLY
jgi:hypothetical protein